MISGNEIQNFFNRYDLIVKKEVERSRTFFTEFRQISENFELQKFQENKARFQDFFSDYTIHHNELKRNSHSNASEYNIFNILKLERKEVITHTPFLANLFDPNGTHCQNGLFLSEFIKMFLLNHPNYHNFKLFNESSINIFDEKHIPRGIHETSVFIDIFILSRYPKNKFVIIIENKIDAPDQKNQLVRYWNYAKNGLRLKEEQIALIYLTKDGKPPTNYSIDEKLQKKLLKENKLFCISYEPQTYNFLNSVVEKVKAENVKLLINQYLSIIKKINDGHLQRRNVQIHSM